MTFKRGLKLISYKLQDNQISKLKQNQDFQFIYNATAVTDHSPHNAFAAGLCNPCIFLFIYYKTASFQYFFMRGG